MKKVVMIGFAFMLAVPVFGRNKHAEKVTKVPGKKMPRAVEQAYINTHGGDREFGPITHHNSRDDHFMATLVDSSLNGYGPYNPTPNPLAYAMDEGYVTVYRQFQGFDVTAGYVGAAQSEDGEEWFAEQKLNECYPGGIDCDGALPTATGTPQGRYPSAGFAPEGKPTAIWNEYTNADYGGGQYGGFPMYTYDNDGVGEFSDWVTPYKLNNGCATTPCDPADLWVGNSYVNSMGGGDMILTALYDGWSDSPSTYYWITSNFHANGYFIMNDAYAVASDGDVNDDDEPLWYDGGNYTSSPDYHINEEGVGYMGQISYAYNSDYEEPKLHTFFYRKTEDYGQTWTSDEGWQNSGYQYISDDVLVSLSDSLNTLFSENPDDYPEQLWYPDATCDSTDEAGNTVTYNCGDSIWYSNVDGPCFLTPGWFFYYDFDMRTDKDGGLHMVTVAVPMVCPNDVGGCEDADGDGLADSLYTEGRFGSGGHVYFYNPDPFENPDNWRATLINDLSETYYADWGSSDIPHINSASYPPMYYFYPEITLSAVEDSEVMWYGSFEGSSFAYNSDSSLYLPSDIDIYMRKSNNLGETWSELENASETEGGIFPDKQLEVSVHLANTATDEQVGVFFQMPDFYNETYPPAGGYEDYMNRVYVGVYTNETLGVDGEGSFSVAPEAFTLKQNYPNPFNPVTNIAFDIKVVGNVTLDLFDVRGAKVQSLVNEQKQVGSHEITFDASHLSSGVYFYSLTSNGVTKTRKLVLMK